MITKNLRHILFVICLLLLSTSCVRLKDTVYLQGNIARKVDDVGAQTKHEKMTYYVKAGDLLYIRVTSADEQSISFLNVGGTSNIPNALSASLMGYRVGLDGCIDYPFCGKIQVAGLQLSEIERKIELAVNRYVDESSVAVKLLNDQITMLGEVKSPGRFPLNSEEINLLEAIAYAGDLTDMANRKKIRLIRNDDGNTPQMLIIDITDEKIMFSPYYYLKAGDIVYVEPKRAKLLALSSSPISLISSVLSIGTILYVTLIR